MFIQQLVSHGLFDVHVKATGDIHIDDHHTTQMKMFQLLIYLFWVVMMSNELAGGYSGVIFICFSTSKSSVAHLD